MPKCWSKCIDQTVRVPQVTNWIKNNGLMIKCSRPEVFCKKGVLKNLAKFTAKHLCWSLFFILKKRLQHRCFPVNFAKFLRTLFTEHLRWQLLHIDKLNKKCQFHVLILLFYKIITSIFLLFINWRCVP